MNEAVLENNKKINNHVVSNLRDEEGPKLTAKEQQLKE
jgi:hypothetical protein